MAARWKNRPDGSNWGDFGADDQLGRLNLLTPEKVKQGVAEVREGLSFCLSLPLNLPGKNILNPRRHAPVLRPTDLEGTPFINYPAARMNAAYPDIISDDAVLLWTQYSSQWDSLAHVGQYFDADGDGKPEVVYYNGYRGGEHVVGPVDYHDDDRNTGQDYTGVSALGIENMAEKPIQGRGVMIDLRAHFGDSRRVVSFSDLKGVMDADGVVVEEGDMVCLHTGFATRIMDMGGEPDIDVLNNSCAALDGRDADLLRWISDSGVAALIADNYAVEAHPATPGDGDCHTMLPLHEHCLFKLGIPLGEIWHLSEFAQWLRSNGRNRFLLTAPPLRLPGAVGSPANPIATV